MTTKSYLTDCEYKRACGAINGCENLNPYRCLVCGAVFRTSVGKNQHLDKHADNKDITKETHWDIEVY